MKKLLKHKSKLQAILTTSRPIIILALALVAAISVVAPAYAIPILGLIIPAWVLWTLGSTAIIGGVVFAEEILTKTAQGITKIFLELIQVLVAVLQPILVPVIKTILSFGLGYPNFLLDSLITNEIWSIAIKIANAAFLLVLLIAAIAIITRANTGIYNLKKFLGGFIMAVALCNFSLIIVKAMVSLGDQLTHTVLSVGTGLGVNLSPSAVGAPPGAPPEGVLLTYFTNMISMKIDPRGWTIPNLAISIMELAIFLITAWIMIKLGLILLERVVRLFAAAVMAPLVFAGSLLPNFQKKAQEWWENTIKWILVLPIMVAFLIVGLKFFSLAGADQPSKMLLIHDYLAPTFIQDAIRATAAGKPFTTPETKAVSEFACALMGLFIFWMAGMVSSSLKLGSVLGGLVETPQKAIALGQKAWKPVTDAFTGKGLIGGTLAGKTLVGQGYARGKAALLAGKLGGGISVGKDEEGKPITLGGWLAKKEAAKRTNIVRAGWDTEANKSMGETNVQIQQATKARTDANTALNRLDGAAVVASAPYGNYSDYADLSTRNPALAERLEKTDPNMAKELNTLKALSKEAGFFTKKTRLDLDQLNPASTYEDDLKFGNTEKIQTAYEALKTHARNKNNVGYEDAAKLLEQYRPQIAKGLGMFDEAMVWTPKKKKEGGEEEEKAVSGSVVSNPKNDSDTDLLRYKEQKTKTENDLKTAAPSLNDTDIKNILTDIGDSAAATITTSELDSADTHILTDIRTKGLPNPDKLNAALGEKDQKKRRAILTKDMKISDENTLSLIDQLATDKNTAWDANAIKGRLAILGKLPPGGSLGPIIDRIRQLQTATAQAKSIDDNQQKQVLQALNNYQITVENTLNPTMRGGGPKTISLAGIGSRTMAPPSPNVKTTTDARDVAEKIQTQLIRQLKSNRLLDGSSNLSALNGGSTQAKAVMDALHQLGIGVGTQASKVSIDTTLKHLRTLTNLK